MRAVVKNSILARCRIEACLVLAQDAAHRDTGVQQNQDRNNDQI